ncbi:MAG: hypothetical protein IPP14_11530 [Planctomycetes bacterium]|nr:hypothetical protein [Planctomycetota bacterium]
MTTSVDALICPHCAASIDVPDGVTRLKCRFCGSTLELRETGSARGLALLQVSVDKIASGVDVIAQHTGALASHTLGARERWKAAYDSLRGRARKRMLAATVVALLGFAAMFATYAFLTAINELPPTATATQRAQAQHDAGASYLFASMFATLPFLLAAGVLQKGAQNLAAEAQALKQREPI